MELLIGLMLALAICYPAYRAGALSRSGAVAAAILGMVVFGLGSWRWAAMLVTFFLSSSLLSRAFKQRKRLVREEYAKGDRRDASQVLANGGPAATFVILHALLPQTHLPWLGFSAALAAANADTWATELGVLGGARPRLITHLGSQVDHGTSGAVSPAGTLAAAAGALLLAFLAALLNSSGGWEATATIASGGFVGALLDSLLGATVQAKYFCPFDHKETEKHPFHGCGTRTVHVRGWVWLNNDWVNASSGAFGSAAACLFATALGVL